ncbi:cytochrome c oxidase subunit 3 [Nocardia miyunensis]|uniref:cytochrome c oxidase subunit 3 n=1 Tax=Nocardia miyunensis TaxID=282684 RepID=UPI001FDF079B|nr:cytochrome c oxidase subunit 3 [Nocardia miyunensis]
MWVFIGGDLIVFGFLFVVYLGYRAKDPDLFARSQRALSVDAGAVNTLILLTSSLLVVLAMRAVRAADPPVASRLVFGAMTCGVAFATVKVFEYYHAIAHNHTPRENDFFLFYFLVTGLHLFHLVLGMGVLIFLRSLAGRAHRLSSHGISFAEGCACFWHLVDLLWIVIFPLVYLVR